MNSPSRGHVARFRALLFACCLAAWGQSAANAQSAAASAGGNAGRFIPAWQRPPGAAAPTEAPRRAEPTPAVQVAQHVEPVAEEQPRVVRRVSPRPNEDTLDLPRTIPLHSPAREKKTRARWAAYRSNRYAHVFDDAPMSEELPPPARGERIVEMPEGETFEPDYGPEGGEYYEDGGCADCEEGGYEDCFDGCEHCDRGFEGCLIESIFRRHYWANLQLLGGVDGFKGPVDVGRNGNFGFYEGINLGGCFWGRYGVGYQVGFRATQSNLSGQQVIREESDVRDQWFLTAGLYRRARCGWQYGAVFDYMQDNYYAQTHLTQVRGELSFVGRRQGEIGVWASIHTIDKQDDEAEIFTHWQTIDMYAAFFRRKFDEGAECRVWGGATGNGDGMVGGDFIVPMSNYWAVQADFNYLIPSNDEMQGIANEAWGISVGIVLTPGGRAFDACRQPFRPLFNVANNSTLIAERLGE